jgi:sarcosine oxidase subunit alpha
MPAQLNGTSMPTPTPLKRTALHHAHVALGAAMVEECGWQRPASYRPPEDELRIVRSAVGLCDISPLGKLDLKGRQIAAGLEHLPTLPPVGQLLRITLGDQPVRCCRLTSDQLLLLTDPGPPAAVVQAVGRMTAADACLHLTDLTSSLAAVQLVGPRSRELLRKLTAVDLSAGRFPDLACAQGGVAGVHALVLRADIGGELAYEIYGGREFGAYLWEALTDAGEEFGGVPFGTTAQRRLHGED